MKSFSEKKKNIDLDAPEKYKLSGDKKMLGTILLLIITLLQVVAWLKIPFLTSIHSYTIGMIFGIYNPIFYIYIAYKALKLILEDIKLPSFIKLNSVTYWFVGISLIFLSVSSSFWQERISNGWTSFGSTQWKTLELWFKDFTSDPSWAPLNTNGGVIGSLLYSIAASATTGIGALTISICLTTISISFLITGSWIGLYKEIKNKTKKIGTKNRNEEILNETRKLVKKQSLEHTKAKIEKTQAISLSSPTKEVLNNDLPFDDPFDD